jgi:nucleoside 2-deoxyribosyltransferase
MPRPSVRKRKVYIASSWRNAETIRILAEALREHGHEVYDFTDPTNYVHNITEEAKEVRDKVDWIECGQMPSTQQACDNDKAGLDWCDAVLMLLPCGRSAHLEAGIALGQGKQLIIYGYLPRGEFEVTYNVTPHRYTPREWNKVLEALA